MAAPQHEDRRRVGYWLAVAGALALFTGGLAAAYLGYAQTSGPDGAVRGYYAALQHSDAPDALAFGTVPAGPHVLLTSTVLAEQQRIAPIRGFSIASTARHGNRAIVRVRYILAFPGNPQRQQDDVLMRRSGDTWRLVRTALATSLYLPAAALRATINGTGVPQGTVLMFPGAVPISYDSRFLELDPATAAVSFASKRRTDLTTRLSGAGKHAAARALIRMLTKCLSAGPRSSAGCPAPDPQYVPGSLRGTLVGDTSKRLLIDLEQNDVGRLDISGQVRLRGHYRRLTFTNQSRRKSGRIKLDIQAYGYAVRPLRLSWGTP
jgi:hypothetical protein